MSRPRAVRAGAYFSASLEALSDIAAATGSAEAVAALLALYRGRAGPEPTLTTMGGKGVGKALGVGRRRGTALLEQLLGLDFGNAVERHVVTTVHHWNRAQGTSLPVSVGDYPAHVLVPRDELVYLPNCLLDGSGRSGNPPLRRLLGEIPRRHRLDALMLLLEYYDAMSDMAFGGCDPTTTVANRWTTDRNVDPDAIRVARPEEILGDLGRIADFHFVAAAQLETEVSDGLVHRVCGSVTEQTRNRILEADKFLRQLGLTYAVTNLFDADPFECSDARFVYPVAVWNQRERGRVGSIDAMQGHIYEAITALAKTQFVALAEWWAEAHFETNRYRRGKDPLVYMTRDPDATLVTVRRPKWMAQTIVNIEERRAYDERSDGQWLALQRVSSLDEWDCDEVLEAHAE